MLRMVTEKLIQEFIDNRDLGKMILVNPDLSNSTIVLEKCITSGKVVVTNRYVFSQYRDDKLSLGQYNDVQQIIHVAHMMGCTHYDPEKMADDLRTIRENKRLVDTILRKYPQAQRS